MERKDEMTRRSILKGTGVGLGMVLAGSAATAEEPKSDKPVLKFKNEDFYDADGKFKLDAAKDAIVAVMKHHGYPVYPDIKEKLWVSDYGAGKFNKLGLAAVMWKNNEEDRYMLMDIYLLPGQMLPEHWHVKTEKNPAKHEGWLVRFGLSHIVGEGEANLPADLVIPKCHCDGEVTVKHDVAATPGVFVPLNREGARHWQFGGPEGAIITEVANVHDNSGVRHSDKALNDYFLNAK